MNTNGTTETTARAARWFFGAPLRSQTYLNLLYLAAAFPLGIAYFVFLVSGFSIGIPMSVFLVGIPMLLAVVFVATQIAAVERTLAEVLLDAEIPAEEATAPDGPVDWLRGLLLNAGTWLGLVFLFSKFALGLVAFCVLTFGLTFALSLVLAPLHYENVRVGIHAPSAIRVEVPDIVYQHDGWTIGVPVPLEYTIQGGELISTFADSIWGALAVSAVGVLVAVGVLHLFNALAWVYARYTELMLRRSRPSILAEWRAYKSAARDG